MNLELRLLEEQDVPLSEIWLNKEHIRKWYDIPGVCTTDDWLSEIKGRNEDYNFITHLIAMCDEKPVGFCQYYKCIHAEEDWYCNISLDGTYSIDYLIGEEAYLGKGIGKSMISLLVRRIFTLHDSERIIVQPDEKNDASNNSLLSNGFAFDKANNLYIISRQATESLNKKRACWHRNNGLR